MIKPSSIIQIQVGTIARQNLAWGLFSLYKKVKLASLKEML